MFLNPLYPLKRYNDLNLDYWTIQFFRSFSQIVSISWLHGFYIYLWWPVYTIYKLIFLSSFNSIYNNRWFFIFILHYISWCHVIINMVFVSWSQSWVALFFSKWLWWIVQLFHYFLKYITMRVLVLLLLFSRTLKLFFHIFYSLIWYDSVNLFVHT